MGVWYCSREDVKSALDLKETARNNAQVDRVIEAASRSIEKLTHRKFYPQLAARYFDWPNGSYSRSWRLWLDADELISVTTLTSGGEAISASDYFLEPANSGPPYTHVEIDLDSSAAFGGGNTHQRDIAITGLFGYSADTTAAGILAEALDSSETGVDVTNSQAIGVGDIIKVDSERMIVTEKSMLDTGQNCSTLTSSAASVSITGVTAGTINTGETILVDSERMLVVDVSGTTLTVKRAWDGSVLASHTNGADIYASRTLTVERAALGTTAASHDTATAITRHVVPLLIRTLCVAEAIVMLGNETAGYARTVGAGENAREAAGRALRTLREEVYSSYGRKARIRAV